MIEYRIIYGKTFGDMDYFIPQYKKFLFWRPVCRDMYDLQESFFTEQEAQDEINKFQSNYYKPRIKKVKPKFVTWRD